MVEPAAIHLWTWDARPYPAFPARADVWSDGGNWRRGHWLSGRLGQAPVDGLIRTLLADHGFRAADVSGVDAAICGYVVGSPGSARSQLEELMRLCGVVAQAQGGRLAFRSIASIPAARTVETFAETDGERAPIEARRSEESETAEEIVVGFLDPARAYQPAAAEAMRAGRSHPRQDTIDLPAAMEEDAARRFASAALGMAAAARETVRFALAPTDVAVEPGDVISVRGAPGRWLVTRIESGAVRRVDARMIPSALPSGRDEVETAVPEPARPQASRPFAVFLDLPQGAAATPEDAPRVASFVRPLVPLSIAASTAGGPFERRLLDADPATVGEIASPLEPGPEGLIDRATTIEARLWHGALSSITRERLLAGGNLCAVRSRSGAWEVLQFESAEEVAPMLFRLRTLIRAQGGTEDAAATGADAGAPFVLLDAATETVGLRASEIGRALEWRIAPIGAPLDDPSVLHETATLGFRAVKPLSPVHLRCAFAANGDVALRWIRRTRIAGDEWEGLDVPLGEEIERYQIAIANAAGAERVVESEGAAVTVTAAEQAETFGALPPRIFVRIAQSSLRHGAGTERRAVFDRPGAAG